MSRKRTGHNLSNANHEAIKAERARVNRLVQARKELYQQYRLGITPENPGKVAGFRHI